MLEDRQTNMRLREGIESLVVSVLRREPPVQASRHTTHYVELSWSLQEDETPSGFNKYPRLEATCLIPFEEGREGLLQSKRRSERLGIETFEYAHVVSGSTQESVLLSTVKLGDGLLGFMNEVRAALNQIFHESHEYSPLQ